MLLLILVKYESSEDSLKTNGITIKTGADIEMKPEMDRIFTAQSNQLMLFQFPDSLPGRLPEEEEENNDMKEEQSPLYSKSKTPKLCSLDHLDEGLIGKLVRHRSGKIKLMLGDSVFDIEAGLSSDFQQNAVTINTNVQQRSANMYSLGEVKAKFNVTPDWNWLFSKMTN